MGEGISCRFQLLQRFINHSSLFRCMMYLFQLYKYVIYFLSDFRTPVHLKNVDHQPSLRSVGKFDVKFSQKSSISTPARKLTFSFEETAMNTVQTIEYIRTHLNDFTKVNINTFFIGTIWKRPHHINEFLV